MSGAASLARRARAGLRDAWLKYFSEVGYLRRDLHWLASRVAERDEIARRRSLAERAPLAPGDEHAVESLRRTGYARARLDDLHPAGGAALLAYLRALSAAFGTPAFEEISAQRRGVSKTYWVNVWQRPQQGSDPLVDLACAPRILAVIAKYLGQAPVLQDVSFYYSPANRGRTSSLIGSQGWHLDNDQKTRAKIFLSPFAIGPRNGPTTLLPLPHSDARRYGNYPGYFDDAQARRFGLDTSRRHEMLAEPGEFYFVDTSRLFHFGSRDIDEPRWLAILTYGPVECYLRQANRRRIYGPGNRFGRENERILAAFTSFAAR